MYNQYNIELAYQCGKGWLHHQPVTNRTELPTDWLCAMSSWAVRPLATVGGQPSSTESARLGVIEWRVVGVPFVKLT